ncbi:MAG: AIR carboxylase family protein [Vicinamibacterales bacterium]
MDSRSSRVRRRRAPARHGRAHAAARPRRTRAERRTPGWPHLLSIQMPGGVPVGTLAIGKAGATNAGLLAVAILATTRPELRERLRAFRDDQTAQVRAAEL